MQYPDRRSKVVGGGKHQGSCDAAIGKGGGEEREKEEQGTNSATFLPLRLN